ncbi:MULTISPECIES: DUF418 domain-containing protein [Solibacillus]|uniref:DUF418 domain-containing protein n=1 Tax=Solibacillus merdavium TaxID=2762218 RepID=A0ABR8XR07_9BACL|nr:DUF418 domain-containing protein [Solibacillus merdavium]MBD8034375.1 DUF418 domain-containing protein [Solibacillus merdavium]
MKKRIEAIDALRGFSLLGILIANMLYFQYSDITQNTIDPTTWWDKGAFYFTKIFVEASFYPIFGFLFGYGIILFIRTLENRDLKTRGPLWRRAIGLMILGVLHIAFVWDGDILFTYGAGLIIIMLFIKRKVKTLLIWATVMTLLMAPLLLLKTDFLALAANEDIVAVLASGTYWEVVQQRIGITEDIPFFIVLLVIPIAVGFMALLSFFVIGPFVLLGMAAAKTDFFANISGKTVLLKRLALLIPIGLACKALLFWDHFAGKLLYGAGTYMLALGYMALFTLLYLANHESKLSKAFASVGRLSLTNYLMQSLIFTTIFYGYGLGFFGELGVAIGLVLAVAFYAIQLFVSTLYSKRFSIGPVEWLLRKFIYLGKG